MRVRARQRAIGQADPDSELAHPAHPVARRVGVIALREYTSAQYEARGIEVHDLEDEVAAFNVPLPRVRIIPLDQFDPETFLR